MLGRRSIPYPAPDLFIKRGKRGNKFGTGVSGGRSHPPALPRPLSRLPMVCSRCTRRPAAVPFSPAATPPTRARRKDQQSHASESRAHYAPPSRERAGGARRKGAASLRSRGLDSNRLPPGDAGHCGIPALPRPPVVWPAAAQSPGRWAPAAPDTGLVACSFTHHGDRGHHDSDGNWYPAPGCSCQDAPAVR